MEQPSPPAAGVTATVDLLQAAADLGVHLLPCGIRQNGGDPVSDYFKPRSTGAEVEGVRVEEVFFRGRKLQGATLALPDGYRACWASAPALAVSIPSTPAFQEPVGGSLLHEDYCFDVLEYLDSAKRLDFQ
ncbi:uncharacterized protein LOC133918434 isoform X3 [Phragmites australis]|uniref:uncharacterized protein LOC133918434 isoform X3 n=1 Tax=Phragmites australis TaxID=29695 RepID=UPI002D7871CB|nr:uncharacterized protein LOC133918434 isoform X3 [Phragmites australis]